MSQTTTPTDPFISLHPSEILMNLVATLLAPMFLGVTGGDIALARMAAIETISAYRAGTALDLIAVAQIVGYGLAALGSLSLSMEDNLSLSMTLRLRGNANACSRSAEQNRRALGKIPAAAPMPCHEPATVEPNPTTPELDLQTPPERHIPEHHMPEHHMPEHHMNDMATRMLAEESLARLRRPAEKILAKTGEQAPEQPPEPAAPQTATLAQTEKRHQEMWAIAMVKESSEITAGILGLPPTERAAASIRAGMLSSTANRLLTGVPSTSPDLDPPPPEPLVSQDRPLRHPRAHPHATITAPST